MCLLGVSVDNATKYSNQTCRCSLLRLDGAHLYTLLISHISLKNKGYLNVERCILTMAKMISKLDVERMCGRRASVEPLSIFEIEQKMIIANMKGNGKHGFNFMI